MIWRPQTAVDPEGVAALAKTLDLPSAVAAVLWRRGFDQHTAPAFLDPRLADLSDPMRLPDMPVAVERLWRAIAAGERITVFGDYDADGITAAALAGRVLRSLGARAAIHLPHRADEGYGLSLNSLRRCLDQTRPDLLLTVDCGSCSAEAVLEARRSGIETIVTDHHLMLGPAAPALAVVNPRRTDATMPVPAAAADLAGVGVAFKLCHAMVKSGRQQGAAAAARVDLRDYLEWAALGTVTDVAPLSGENRILVAAGLKQINRSPGLAVRALMSAAGAAPPLSGRQIAFALGPRLNAAGRLGDARAALDLLLTEDPAVAERLALELDAANCERRALVDSMATAAESQIVELSRGRELFGIAVGDRDWHPGVIGIVAARIAQQYNRPAVVVAFDKTGHGRGSARGIEGFHLLDGLQACAGNLTAFGGHAMAAGLSLPADRLEAFRDGFESVCAAALRDRDLRPVLAIEDWLDPSEIDLNLAAAVQRLEPFGEGNPQPVWAWRGARIRGLPRTVGNGHLKMTLDCGGRPVDAIGFNLAARSLATNLIDLAFRPVRNQFRGRSSLQLQIQDFRPTENS